MGEDRRRYPRACRPLDVTLDASGRQRPGKTVNLSPYGAKVALSGPSVPLGSGVIIGLRLALPDGDLSLGATVVRTDPDGVALDFGTLEVGQLQRLKDLVDSLLVQEWRELLTELQGSPGVPASIPSSDRDVTLKEVRPEESPPSPPPVPAAAQAKEAAGQPSVFARQRGRATTPKPSETPAGDDSETERLRALLSRLGLGSLQLPPGPLTGHWREFLKRHEAE